MATSRLRQRQVCRQHLTPTVINLPKRLAFRQSLVILRYDCPNRYTPWIYLRREISSYEQQHEILSTAYKIWERERRQAQEIQAGRKLGEQLQFDEYLTERSTDASYTFRQHLRSIGGAIEE